MDAMNTCNACDASPISPDSPAGYCAACERDARAATADRVRAQQKATGAVLTHFLKGGMTTACGRRARSATRNAAEVTCTKCRASGAFQRAAG